MRPIAVSAKVVSGIVLSAALLALAGPGVADAQQVVQIENDSQLITYSQGSTTAGPNEPWYTWDDATPDQNGVPYNQQGVTYRGGTIAVNGRIDPNNPTSPWPSSDGGSASITFTGTRVAWYENTSGIPAGGLGNATVWLDGGQVGMVSHYASTFNTTFGPSTLAYDSGPLANGTHTLTIKNDLITQCWGWGQWQTCTSFFGWITLDYFEITQVVADTQPPTIDCPGDLTVEAPGGETSAIVTYQVTATDDSDPAPTVTVHPPSGFAFPLGQTTVHASAKDTSGNEATCDFSVTVLPTSIALQAKEVEVEWKTPAEAEFEGTFTLPDGLLPGDFTQSGSGVAGTVVIAVAGPTPVIEGTAPLTESQHGNSLRWLYKNEAAPPGLPSELRIKWNGAQFREPADAAAGTPEMRTKHIAPDGTRLKLKHLAWPVTIDIAGLASVAIAADGTAASALPHKWKAKDGKLELQLPFAVTPGQTFTFLRPDGTSVTVTVETGVNYFPSVAHFEVKGTFDAAAAGLAFTSTPTQAMLTLTLAGDRMVVGSVAVGPENAPEITPEEWEWERDD